MASPWATKSNSKTQASRVVCPARAERAASPAALLFSLEKKLAGLAVLVALPLVRTIPSAILSGESAPLKVPLAPEGQVSVALETICYNLQEKIFLNEFERKTINNAKNVYCLWLLNQRYPM